MFTRNVIGQLSIGLFWGCLSLTASAGYGEEVELQRFQRSEPHMGTSFGIVFYAADETSANRAFTAGFARIAELNRICSDYDLDSELSRLSAASPTTSPVRVSDDLFAVLAASQELSRRSEGAFDITVGPITRLWRRARIMKRLPAPDRLREAMSAVGYQHLVLHPADQSVELLAAGMRLDLGAIAKGYASDEVLRVLQGLGIDQALVNAGGNIAVGDPPPGEKGWRIEIAPLEPHGKPTLAVYLSRAAVATSGDAFQFVELNGRRYSHIVDPHTGYGLTQRSSVTVIAPTGILADGLSTAVSVLGEPSGLKLVESTPGCAAHIVRLEDDKPITKSSAGFSQWVPGD